MPNHFMSKIYLEGDQKRIQEMLEHVKYDDGDIGSLDCNKIIPMPESLNMESGSIEWESIGAYLSKVNPLNTDFPIDDKLSFEEFNKINDILDDTIGFRHLCTIMSYQHIAHNANARFRMSPDEFIDLGAKYVSNLLKYGATSWYYWRYNNWGSKWGAYDAEPFANNTMTFKTANAPIIPVISKLGSMYQDIKITYKFADEDIGRNTGMITLFNLASDSCMPADDSEEAWEIVRECWGLSRDELENDE